MTRHLSRRDIACAALAGWLASLPAAAPLTAQSVRPAAKSSPGSAIRNADELVTRDLLRGREFRRLESMLAAYADSMRADISYEPVLFYSFVAFSVPDPALRPHLDAWVAAKSSAHAHIARAAHSVAMGWEARGAKYAEKTSREQFAAMRERFREALEDLEIALRKDSTAVAAYWFLQDVARASGSQKRNRQVVQDALRLAPASLLLRARHMLSLRPRWGGSHEEMQRFAEESQAFVGQNPRLTVLRGFVRWDEGRTLCEEDDHEGALAKFTEALEYGESPLYRVARANILLYNLDREEGALIDYNRVLRQRPQHAEALVGRALAYWFLSDQVPPERVGEYERLARADFARAVQVDPSDHYVRYAMKHYPELRDSP